MVAKVLLDTSALLAQFEQRLDIREAVQSSIGEAEFFVPAPCIKELRRLARLRSARGRRASMALKWLHSIGAKILRVRSAADEALVRCALLHKALLCTTDARLATLARRLGAKLLRLRA